MIARQLAETDAAHVGARLERPGKEVAQEVAEQRRIEHTQAAEELMALIEAQGKGSGADVLLPPYDPFDDWHGVAPDGGQ